MPVKVGKQTLVLQTRPTVAASAAVGGQKEKEGPLGEHFDFTSEDSRFGQNTWEKAEKFMQEKALETAAEKAGLPLSQVDFLFSGDLLNQCVASGYAARSYKIPFIGLYGACSTIAEGLALAALFADAGAAEAAVAVASSHFCTAERQYRFPLEYGGQRPPTAQWTATAAGAAVVTGHGAPPFVRAVCFGCVEDLGVQDQNNMGAAMAPAAASTLGQFFTDTGTHPRDYDLILSGDLGYVGSRLFEELLMKEGLDIHKRHQDCGLLLYDREAQQMEAGGSGCGCAASVAAGYLLPRIRKGEYKNVLFMATGALMSPLSVQQGESIPGIAHLLYFTAEERGVF